MTSLSGARALTCVAAVAVVGGSGALFPSPARADDGTLAAAPATELASVTPEVDAALGALAQTGDSVDAALAPGAAPEPPAATTPAEPVAEAAEPASPTAVGTPEDGFFTPPPAPAEPTAAGTPEGGRFAAPTPTRAEPTVVATPEGAPTTTTEPPARPIDTAIRPRIIADTTPTPRTTGAVRGTGSQSTDAGAAASTPGTASDTPAADGDTGGDTGATDGHTSIVAPSATQSSPSNVNVSVRIGSPGDTGAVTQLNLATAVFADPTALAPLTGAPVASGDAQGGVSSPSAGSASAGASPGATLPAGGDQGTWSWQWDCLSVPDLTSISKMGSGTGYLPTTWTWIWNCGDNPGQYQGATSSQYHPSNVNVSIRISSPGTDGPVTQSNVAVAVGASTAAHGATTIATSSQALPALAGVPSVPLPDVPALVAAVAAEAIVDLPSPVAAVAPLIEQGTEAISTFPGLAGSLDEPLEIPFVPAMLARPFVFPAGGFASRPLVPGRSVLAPAVGTAPGIAVAAERSHGALTSGEASGRTGAAPPHADRGRDAGRPRWHAPERPALPEPAPSAASAAPATGGGSSNGGIPIFLALPFLAAMLDLARRVVPVGMALPSGHRSRVPDDPG